MRAGQGKAFVGSRVTVDYQRINARSAITGTLDTGASLMNTHIELIIFALGLIPGIYAAAYSLAAISEWLGRK